MAAPALTSRWPLAAFAVIALLALAVVAGNHVFGMPARLAAEKQSTVSRRDSSTDAALSTALAANGTTLQADEQPLLLYCNVTSPCTICAPSSECSGFRHAPASPCLTVQGGSQSHESCTKQHWRAVAVRHSKHVFLAFAGSSWSARWAKRTAAARCSTR